MLKAGIYKFESTNQRMFCYEINPPDLIKTWFEDKEGNHDISDDNWWDLDITPQKFHWLVDEWNNGNIKKVYPHWWESVDTRKEHINSLLQLNHTELQEVLNYAAYIWPHYRWTTELQLNNDIRPLMYRGKVLRFVNISKDKAIEHNKQEKIKKKYRTDMELYGKTDSEFISELLNSI